MADSKSPAAGSHQRVLETAVPLSQSVIWGLQTSYYAQRGLKAWTEDEVPSYITSNPFIAETCAGMVAAFLEDCRPLSAANPARILELGAGTGKFSCLFLRKLMPLLREKNINAESMRYLMTDCSPELLAYWKSNEHLAEFSQAGILDFQLLRAGESFPATQAPLVVIANYVFDSLPQDAFVIREGQLHEELLTTTSSSETAVSLADLQLSFTASPANPQRYHDPLWNSILQEYCSRLKAGSFFFPAAALELVQQLGRASDGRMLLLAADKGFAYEEELALTQPPPALEFHASRRCFSTLVNFHAICRYFAAAGGLALLPEKHSTNLNLCAFIARRPEDEFPQTRSAHQQTVTAFGPDDLFAVMSWLNPYLESLSVAQALSLLRLTRWDTTAFLRLFPVIAPRLRTITAERHDLREAVLRVWENRYPVEPVDNVLAFNCGVVLLELRFYIEAAAMLEASERMLGRTASTSYNLGLCALGLDDPAAALAHMTEACRLDPAFEPARASRERLERELKSS
jgi:putative S-adenosyl-L-methionine-dependent methyltransferase